MKALKPGDTLSELISKAVLPEKVANILREKVVEGKTILIVGQTGSGKSTLLNALVRDTLQDTKLLVIEDDESSKQSTIDDLQANILEVEPSYIIMDDPTNLDTLKHVIKSNIPSIITVQLMHGKTPTSARLGIAPAYLGEDETIVVTLGKIDGMNIVTSVAMKKLSEQQNSRLDKLMRFGETYGMNKTDLPEILYREENENITHF